MITGGMVNHTYSPKNKHTYDYWYDWRYNYVGEKS